MRVEQGFVLRTLRPLAERSVSALVAQVADVSDEPLGQEFTSVATGLARRAVDPRRWH